VAMQIGIDGGCRLHAFILLGIHATC